MLNLALRADGSLVTWGANYNLQLNLPAGLTNVVAIACGGNYSMALRADGQLFTWGDDSYGQTNIPSGLTNGTVAAWGYNADGATTVPATLSNVVAIAAGNYDSYALTDQGAVVAWGYSSSGATNVPSGLTNVVGISGGFDYALAIAGEGQPIPQTFLSNPSWTAKGFSVFLPSQSGRVYQLEYKNSLSDANWTPLPLTAGNGGLLTLTDPTTNSSQRFYRVRRW